MSEPSSGVLKRGKGGAGVLRDPDRSFRPGEQDIIVPPGLIREYALVEGVTLQGALGQHGSNGQTELTAIETICGLSPQEFRSRKPFVELVAIDPGERFDLASTGDPGLRIIDLIAPIGRGTRGLIVSPARAGKTMLLCQLARAFRTINPGSRIIILLIDERPEEVTDIRRSVEAEVLASTSDQGYEEQVELTELLLAHIRTDLECGREVIVLVDSLTRMGRAFNLKGSGTGKMMSGGMEARALEIPRRFFGLARNIEHGGSVTIIATALINTGSRMDELIFEEFKGTGNSEIVLDRKLAESRLFPAINLTKSSTRKEERLFKPDEVRKLHQLRRFLAGYQPREALEKLRQLIDKYPTNEKLLNSFRGE